MCNTRLTTSSSPQLVSIKLRSIWKANKNGHAEFQNFVRLLGDSPWGRQSSHYLVITWISTKRVRLESAQTCRSLQSCSHNTGHPRPVHQGRGTPEPRARPPVTASTKQERAHPAAGRPQKSNSSELAPGAAQKSKDRAPPMKAITGGCLVLEPQVASPPPCPCPAAGCHRRAGGLWRACR